MFHTPGCRNTSRDDSRQYQDAGVESVSTVVYLIRVNMGFMTLFLLSLNVTDAVLAQLLSVFLWATLVLYGGASLWWLIRVFILSYGWQDTNQTEVGFDNIQVRVLTIAAEETVQRTVSSIPDEIAESLVIAEEAIDIAGADVHVVPDDFECAAQRKGRAIEWARQQIPCEKEYVLYLDEDTLLSGFSGLPAADIIQLSEHPLRTHSRLTYVCEIFRIGFQFEQRAFHRVAYPAYAWGGAVAVRHELEEQITWNVPSITEDTTFIWRAAARTNIDYRLATVKARNQAPPTLKSLIKQRRRWVSGTIKDRDLLPRRYQPFVFSRIVIWALSPIIPLFGVIIFVFPEATPSSSAYLLLSALLFGIVFLYMTFGLVEYRKYPEVWWAYIVVTPLAVLVHSLGALWGIIQPIDDFEVTRKTAAIDTGSLEDRNPELREDESGYDTELETEPDEN